MKTMMKLLEHSGLGRDSQRYTYAPLIIPQWQESATNVVIELENRQDNLRVLKIFFSQGEDCVTVFQTTFLEKGIKKAKAKAGKTKTFIAEALASRYFHDIEMDYDDENRVYTSNDYDDTLSCLNTLIGFLSDARPVSVDALEPAQEDNVALQFIAQLDANNIGIEQSEDAVDLLRHLMAAEGFDYLCMLIKALTEDELNIPDSRFPMLKNMAETFFQEIIAAAIDDFDLSDKESIALKPYLLGADIGKKHEKNILEKACADTLEDLYEVLVDLSFTTPKAFYI